MRLKLRDFLVGTAIPLATLFCSSCNSSDFLESKISLIPYKDSLKVCECDGKKYTSYITQFGDSEVLEVKSENGKSITFYGSLSVGEIEYLRFGGPFSNRYSYNELSYESKAKVLSLFLNSVRSYSECFSNKQMEKIDSVYYDLINEKYLK